MVCRINIDIRVIRKVRQNTAPEPLSLVIHRVRLKKKTCKKVHYHSSGGETQKTINFGELSFILSFLFPFFLSASTAATYIFTAPTCTTATITLEPCALDAEFRHFVLSWSMSYCDFIKCLYFADTTERGDSGWKEAQRQSEDRVYFADNSIIWVGLYAYDCSVLPLLDIRHKNFAILRFMIYYFNSGSRQCSPHSWGWVFKLMGGETFPKVQCQTCYCLIIGPLLWECPLSS